MYASELRTCGLGAVVAVLLGGGVGFGWHFFADSVRAEAAAITPLAQQDAPNPPMACPPPPREGPVRDATLPPVLSRPNNQPDTTHTTGTLKVTHALHALRARQVPPPGRSDGSERAAF